MTNTQPTSFKCTSVDGKFARRLRFPAPPSFAELSGKLIKLWGSRALNADTLGLSYVDLEGDRVVFSSEDELQGLYDELRGSGREAEVVKLRLVVLGQELEIVAEGETKGVEQQQVEHGGSTQEVPAEPAQAVAESEMIATDGEQKDREEETAPDPPSPAALPAPLDASEKSSEVVQSTDPSDPPEEFPEPSSIESTPQSTQQPQQPSLLDDISSLFSTFAASPAMSALLARAATGAYTPTFTSNVHSHASDLASQATAAQTEIARVLAQVHEELRRNGLTAVDDKLREVEQLTGGWTEKLKDGLREVQQMAAERRRAADAQTRTAHGSAAQDTSMEANDGQQASPSFDATMPGSFDAPIVPPSAASPYSTLFDGFASPVAPVPPSAPEPSTFAPLFDGLRAPVVQPVTPHAPPHQRTTPRFAPPPGPPPVSTLFNDFRAGAVPVPPSHSRPQGSWAAPPPRHSPRFTPGHLGPPLFAAPGAWIDRPHAGPAASAAPIEEEVLEQAVSKLNEMGFPDPVLREFIRGMLAAQPSSEPNTLVLDALKYKTHDFNLSGFYAGEHGQDRTTGRAKPDVSSTEYRRDRLTMTGARAVVCSRLSEMGIERDNVPHLVNGQLAVDKNLKVEDVIANTLRLIFAQK